MFPLKGIMIDPADSLMTLIIKSGNKEVCRWFAPAVIFLLFLLANLHADENSVIFQKRMTISSLDL